MTFFKQEGEKLICLLCAHYCHLGEGQIGLCGVNQSTNGTVKNLVYGHLSALHVDPIEKKTSVPFFTLIQSLFDRNDWL